MKIWEPVRCNCLIWALIMKFKYKGVITWRWSYIGWWPHFFWSPDKYTIYEYVPLEYEEGHWLRKLYFKGCVQIMISEVIKKEVIRDATKELIILDMTSIIKDRLK